jgi:HEPN domain-containing protein
MAGYGFEEGIDAEYFKDYAPEAVKKAENVLGLCSRLVRTLFGGGTKKS